MHILFKQQVAPLQTGLQQLTTAVDPDSGSIDERLFLIMGQGYPSREGRWPMNIHDNVLRLRALEPVVEVLRDLLAETRADVLPRLALAEAKAATLTLALQAVEAYEAKATAVDNAQEAKLTLQAAQIEQNRLDLLANAAQDALLKNRTTATEQALATAQANLTTAQAATTAAQGKADAADAKASQAKTDAATAIAQATAAQAELTAFKARFREGTAATPQITIQVASPGVATVNFSPDFADSKYRVALGKSSNSLLALDLSVPEASKQPGSFTIQLRNTGLVSLAVAAGSVDYIIMHD